MTQPAQPVLSYASGVTSRVGFVSASGRAKIVIALLSNMLLAGTLVWSESLQYGMLNGIKSGVGITAAQANANDTRQETIVLVYLASLVLTLIFFMIWIHRAYRNLNSFPVERSKYTPGWAVGFYFVPILQLVRGYQVMREIYDKSRPPDRLGRSGSIVALWWALCILWRVINSILDSAGGTAGKDLNGLLTLTSDGMIIYGFAFLPGICALVMVMQIDQMQRESSMLPDPPQRPLMQM